MLSHGAIYTCFINNIYNEKFILLVKFADLPCKIIAQKATTLSSSPYHTKTLEVNMFNLQMCLQSLR